MDIFIAFHLSTISQGATLTLRACAIVSSAIVLFYQVTEPSFSLPSPKARHLFGHIKLQLWLKSCHLLTILYMLVIVNHRQGYTGNDYMSIS